MIPIVLWPSRSDTIFGCLRNGLFLIKRRIVNPWAAATQIGCRALTGRNQAGSLTNKRCPRAVETLQVIS